MKTINTLNELQNYIEGFIKDHLPDATSYPSHIAEAMNYAMTAGGKRIRPTLMLLAYNASKESGSDASDEASVAGANNAAGDSVVEVFAAALEMIHTHSLIHDDLPALDNDTMRRGRPTVHVQFDESTAILAGDALLNFAYETALKAYEKVSNESGSSISNSADISKDYFKALQILAGKT